jgi:hypothetical protein
MRERGNILSELAGMVYIGEVRVGLRSAGASRRAVVSADAAGSVLREINVVMRKMGRLLGVIWVKLVSRLRIWPSKKVRLTSPTVEPKGVPVVPLTNETLMVCSGSTVGVLSRR